jgi:Ca2+-binding RTX toxin-like protein
MAIPKPNIATAAKTATTSAAVNADVLAAAAKQSPLINPNQVQNQGIDGSSQDNKPRPGFEGPSPNIPEVSKPGADSLYPKSAPDEAKVNELMGRVSNADAFKQLAGMVMGSTTGSSAVDQITALTAPGGLMAGPGAPSPFDQGFGSQPNVDANMVPVGNPMAAFQSASVGEPLETAGANDPNNRVNGIVGQGIGAVSNNPQADAIKGVERIRAVENILEELAAGDKTDALFDAGALAADLLWDISPMGELPVTAGVVILKSAINEGQLNYEMKKNKESADAAERQAKLDWVRAKEAHILKEAKKNDVHIPNPDKPYGSNVNILTQPMLNQIIASKAGKPTTQGGSGDATPVDNGGIPQVVNNGSIAVNQGSINQRNLVGQPGGAAIGENMSGGNKGLNGFGRSNGAGAIDPGNEAGIPSGDPRFQQDPANALPGNKPAPTLQSPVGTQENQSSSVSTTLASGIRNLTLTGTAAINGTGNDLDNLINGNGAANELRGGAGNDILDGGSGRDQLTGGSGADRFRFATPGAFDTAQADRITDFSRSEGDRIELSRSAFGLAAGATLSFQSVNSDAELTRALGSSSLLIQDLRNGSILFNQNGTVAGAGQGGVFAVVNQGLILQAGDFALGA